MNPKKFKILNPKKSADFGELVEFKFNKNPTNESKNTNLLKFKFLNNHIEETTKKSQKSVFFIIKSDDLSMKYETYLTTQKSITNIWKEDLITNCEFLLKTFIKSYCGYDEYLISDGVFCLLGDDCMRSGMLNSDDIGDDSYNDITNNDNSYNTGDIDDNNTNINTNNIYFF